MHTLKIRATRGRKERNNAGDAFADEIYDAKCIEIGDRRRRKDLARSFDSFAVTGLTLAPAIRFICGIGHYPSPP